MILRFGVPEIMIQSEDLPSCVMLHKLCHLSVALLPITKLPFLSEIVVKNYFKALEVLRNYNRKTGRKQIIVSEK